MTKSNDRFGSVFRIAHSWGLPSWNTCDGFPRLRSQTFTEEQGIYLSLGYLLSTKTSLFWIYHSKENVSMTNKSVFACIGRSSGFESQLVPQPWQNHESTTSGSPLAKAIRGQHRFNLYKGDETFWESCWYFQEKSKSILTNMGSIQKAFRLVAR